MSRETILGKKVGNYRVEKLLGSGGMGAVYLLRHLQLPNTFIAMKVLHANGQGSSNVAERFVQEAMVAAAIGGHRVARPIDLGRLDDDVPYILMEYVPGRTLAQVLADGPLPLLVLLRIAWRVADTMALAHDRQIVHRDLKPSNIMLQSDDGTQVKVLDFGVARAGGDLKRAQTQETAILGSPGYMSPEAALGLPVDGRTDVFSLGVTLWKAVSGELPLPPATDRKSVQALLEAPLPPLRSREPVPELEEWLRHTLARDAADRPSMAELREGLLELLLAASPDEALSIMTTPPPPAPAADGLADTISFEEASARLVQPAAPPRRSRRPLVLAVAGLVAVAATVWAVLFRHAPLPTLQRGERRTLAILPFRGDPGGVAAAQMLVDELRSSDDLRVVPPERVTESGLDANTKPNELARALGSRLLLFSDYHAGDLELTLRDGDTGRALEKLSIHSAEAQLAAKAAQALRPALGIAAAPPRSHGFVGLEAARTYSAGSDALRRGEYLTARDLFSKCIAAEPDHALPHAQLAQAWTRLGDADRAAAEAHRAVALAQDLGRADRLLVEALAHESLAEWRPAADAYAALFQFFPDDIEYGVALANVQYYDSRNKEALETLATLRKLPPPLGQDPRIDLIEAPILQGTGELKRARGVAEAAIAESRKRGLPMREAMGRLRLARVLAQLSEIPAANREVDAAQPVFQRFGDKKMQALALGVRASIAFYAGDTRANRAALEQEIAIDREIGDHNDLATALCGLANVADSEGDHQRSIQLNRECVEIAGDQDRDIQLTGLTNLGRQLLIIGKRDEGVDTERRALALARTLGNQHVVALTLGTLAQTLKAKGDLTEAMRVLEEALELARKLDEPALQAGVLNDMALIETNRGNRAAAAEAYRQCQRLAAKAGQQQMVAVAQEGEAELLLADGHYAEAEKLAQQAALFGHEQKQVELEALSKIVEARALLGLKRREPALHAMGEALQLSAGTALDVRNQVHEQAAQIRAATGDVRAALSELDEAIHSAEKDHDEEQELLRLRITRETIAWQKQNDRGAGQRLAKLAVDAKQQGLIELARAAESGRRK